MRDFGSKFLELYVVMTAYCNGRFSGLIICFRYGFTIRFGKHPDAEALLVEGEAVDFLTYSPNSRRPSIVMLFEYQQITLLEHLLPSVFCIISTIHANSTGRRLIASLLLASSFPNPTILYLEHFLITRRMSNAARGSATARIFPDMDYVIIPKDAT